MIAFGLFSSGCVAHHKRVGQVKVVSPVKIMPTKVVVSTKPKAVVVKTQPQRYVVFKKKPKTGVCKKHGAVWHCRN